MIFSRNKLAAPKPQKAKQSAGMLDDDEDITDIVSSFVPVDRPKPVAPPVAPMSAMKASGSTSPNNGPAVNTGPKAMFFGPGDDFDNSAPRTPQAPAARLDPSQDPAAKLAERQAANRAAQEQAAADAEARDVERRRNEQLAARGNASVTRRNEQENAQNRDLDGDGKIGDRLMTDDELIRQSIMELLSPIDRTAARAAAASGLDQRNAEATENMRARTGLAGMGLSGAAGAAVGAEGRKGEREKVLALDEFDRNARAEDLQRQLAAAGQYREQTAFEESLNALDTEPPSRREYPVGAEGDAAFQRDLKIWNDLGAQDKAADPVQNLDDKLSKLESVDPWTLDPDTEPGTQQEPFVSSDMTRSQLETYLSETNPDALPLKVVSIKQFGGPDIVYYVDKFGHYFYLDKANGGQQLGHEPYAVR